MLLGAESLNPNKRDIGELDENKIKSSNEQTTANTIGLIAKLSTKERFDATEKLKQEHPELKTFDAQFDHWADNTLSLFTHKGNEQIVERLKAIKLGENRSLSFDSPSKETLKTLY